MRALRTTTSSHSRGRTPVTCLIQVGVVDGKPWMEKREDTVVPQHISSGGKPCSSSSLCPPLSRSLLHACFREGPRHGCKSGIPPPAHTHTHKTKNTQITVLKRVRSLARTCKAGRCAHVCVYGGVCVRLLCRHCRRERRDNSFVVPLALCRPPRPHSSR